MNSYKRKKKVSWSEPWYEQRMHSNKGEDILYTNFCHAQWKVFVRNQTLFLRNFLSLYSIMLVFSETNFIPITYWIEFHSFYYPSDILFLVYVSVNIEISEVAETLNNLIRNAFLLLEKVESINVAFQFSEAQGWMINVYLIFNVKLSSNMNMRIILFIQDC